jgi:alpha-D-xyloside xylohydrolase
MKLQLGENGQVSVNGASLGWTETAWLCYKLAHSGETAQTEPLLTGLAQKLGSRLESAHTSSDSVAGNEEKLALDAAYWLWALGVCRSASQSTNDKHIGSTTEALISASVAFLEKYWHTPQSHWLAGEGEAAVWFSNLAVFYGGLLAVQPHTPTEQERIQQLLKAIRELTFAKLIKDGRIVSRLGSADIYGDIVISAVPFGLLGIEDRILIEALAVVESELAAGQGVRFSESDTYYGGCERPDLTCLLAWYYSEKGEMARAKVLLAQVDRLLERDNGILYVVDSATAREPLYASYWTERSGEPPFSPLAMILQSVAQHNIAAKQIGGQAAQRIHFQHEPIGTADPYYQYACERYPREPVSGDLVTVRAVTQPFRHDQEMTLNIRVNGGMAIALRMSTGNNAAGESYWEAPLGRFSFGDKVTYWFEAVDDGSISDLYTFRVRQWVSAGPVTGLERIGQSVRLFFPPVWGAEAGTSMTIAESSVTRALNVRFEVSSEPPGKLKIPEEDLCVQLGDMELKLAVSSQGDAEFVIERQGTVLLSSYGKHGQPFLEWLTDGSGRLYKARCNFRLDDSDRLYGMGERYSSFEYRGMTVDNYVYNEYRSQGMRTYLPVPIVINTRGYGLFANTPMYSVFDFGETLSDRMQIQVELHASCPALELIMMPGQPLDIVRQYTDVTGKPELPPKWAFGPWMSSNNWDSQAEVDEQLSLTNRHEIPATVFVLEQWSDEATFYIFNDAQYEAKNGNQALRYEDYRFPEWGRWPDPKGMVESLHDNGLKVLLWQIPIHKFMYGIAHAQKDADEIAMLSNGYEVKMANGAPYRIPYNWFKDSLVIDFTSEAARDWWFEKRKYLLNDIGVDGFKTDGGECIFGHDLQFADGRTGDEMRNLYPNAYIGSYYSFVQEHVPDGGITFSRAGYTGAQRYPLHWAGDERSTFEAFKSSLHAGLSSGLSGIPFWGWDMAGFHGDIPTAELYIRSAQMAAFCPVMQYHAETKGQFNQDRTPWNIADRTGKREALSLYKKFADIRMNLLPYIYAQALESSRSGIPMMRAMFAAYPEDRSCLTQTAQYLFGDSLLVAPVIEEGHFMKNIYFPEGNWMPLFGCVSEQSGSRYVTVRADLDHIPVYMRENSIVPLNLGDSLRLANHVGNRVDSYEHLTFCAYVTGELEYVFEDDLDTRVDISIRKLAAAIHVVIRSNYQGPLTVWLKGADAIKSAANDAGEYSQAGTEQDMQTGTYLLRDGDCLLRLFGYDETLTLTY